MYYFGVITFFAVYLHAYAAEYTKVKMIGQWRLDYVRAVLRQEIAWFDVSAPEQLSTRIGESAGKLEKAFGTTTFVAWEMLGMGLSGLALAFYFEWDTTLVAIGTTPIAVVAAVVYGYASTSANRKVKESYATAGGHASETLFAIRTVSAFGLEKKAQERYEGQLAAAEAASAIKSVKLGFAVGALDAAMWAMLAVGWLYGGWMLYKDRARSVYTYAAPSPHQNVSYCALACNPYDPLTLDLMWPVGVDCVNGSNGGRVPLQMTCETSSQLASLPQVLLQIFYRTPESLQVSTLTPLELVYRS